MKVELPSSISQALGSLVGALAAEGFVPSQVEQSSSFGNFVVAFARGSTSLSVVRDRGQLHVAGPEQAELEAAGLWRAFSDPQSIVEPMLVWLRTHGTV